LVVGFENGKLVRVTIRATKGGLESVNTFHYDLQDDALQPANDPQTLADVFRDDVLAVFKTRFRAAWTIQPVVVVEEKDPLNPTNPRGEWTSGSPIAGTRSGSADLLPSAITSVITLKTASIGRRFTGRLFLGGDFDDDATTGNNWQAGSITENDNFIAAVPVQPDIQDGESSSTANWCVYSRTQRAADLDPYAAHITGHISRSEIHWLRSRAK
jgi:hypothetical protein